jgi:uncharacterized membrane protein
MTAYTRALILASALTVFASCASSEQSKVDATASEYPAEEMLVELGNPDRAKSRLQADPDARSGYAMVADPADKPGAGVIWGRLTYTQPPGAGQKELYHQSPGKIRCTFRLKVADNTIDKPVVSISASIDGGELKKDGWKMWTIVSASHQLKGTDFAAPDVYQEFLLDLLKGEQGYGNLNVSTTGLTKVAFDGLTVQQISRLDMAELLESLDPPVRPAGLTLGGEPFLVHETHGMYMKLWRMRQAMDRLPELLRAGAKWEQSYLNVHPMHNTLSGYPSKWEDLYCHRAVVLNNVPASAVTVVGTMMLKEYVQDGGCLVMMGDTHSLSLRMLSGGWDSSLLAPLLPVTLPSDLVYGGGPLTMVPQTESLRQADLDWSSAPYTLYCHKAIVNPEAEVLVAAGEVPLVVQRKVGKGRIVVLLCAVLGEKMPDATGVPFWEWKDWPTLMAAVLAGDQAEAR